MLDFFNTIIEEQEYICGNKFIDLSNAQNIVFSKIDNVPEFNGKLIDTFITHNGDYSVDKFFFKSGPKFKRWFAQNKNFDNSNIISIPIGLENFEPEFSFKSQFGRFSSLPKDAPAKKDFLYNISINENNHNNLVYMNFNPSTFPERINIKNYFDNFKWVYKKQSVSWQEYYIDIVSSKFVISPRGNGIDCHRIWESLYLRTIPIVKKEYFMHEFDDLPILFIDSWEEITEDFLLKKYDEFKNKKFNLEKLKISYWEIQIGK